MIWWTSFTYRNAKFQNPRSLIGSWTKNFWSVIQWGVWWNIKGLFVRQQNVKYEYQSPLEIPIFNITFLNRKYYCTNAYCASYHTILYDFYFEQTTSNSVYVSYYWKKYIFHQSQMLKYNGLNRSGRFFFK